LHVSRILEKLTDRTVFFVIGVPKSGSTWLQRLLDSHPEIACRGEDDFSYMALQLSTLMNDYNQGSVQRNVQQGNQRYCQFSQADYQPALAALVQLLLGRAAEEEGGRCIGSKFLNFSVDTRAFDQLVPDSRYLHIMRDPRDLMVSAYFFNVARNPETVKQIGEGTLADYIRFAIPGYLKQINAYLDFSERAGKRLLTVHYHALHDQPEDCLAETFRFLGVDDSKAVVRQSIAANHFEARSGRPLGQEIPTAFLRKGVVGDWREKFDDGCRAAIDASPVAELLRRFGFEPS